jgi:hypothetical protein
MWFHRSELLGPLTSLKSSKVKFQWHSSYEHAFEKIKKVIIKEILLCYHGFNDPFHLYTDTSDHQLGTVIMQDKKPIAFYSQKLNTAQNWYISTEKTENFISY